MAEPRGAAATDATGPIGVLVFDGDCGFCTTSARWFERHIAPADLRVTPWQRTDLAALRLTPGECNDAVQWVNATGDHASGAAAAAAALRASGGLWRPVGVLLDLPGIRRVATIAYRLVAANRHRLPGGTPACKVEPPN